MNQNEKAEVRTMANQSCCEIEEGCERPLTFVCERCGRPSCDYHGDGSVLDEKLCIPCVPVAEETADDILAFLGDQDYGPITSGYADEADD